MTVFGGHGFLHDELAHVLELDLNVVPRLDKLFSLALRLQSPDLYGTNHDRSINTTGMTPRGI